MKKYLINTIILIILFILVIGLPNQALAAETAIFGDDFFNEYDPTKSSAGIEGPIMEAIVQIVNRILGALQIIGGLAAVISIAFYGFRHILNADPGLGRDLGLSNNEMNSSNIRIELNNWARVMIIGSLILFFGSTIVKIVFKLLVTAGNGG